MHCEESFNLYNNKAYKEGFSVRKCNTRYHDQMSMLTKKDLENGGALDDDLIIYLFIS